MLHLQRLRAFKGVSFPLEVTIRPDRNLHMLGEGVVQGQVMVAHYNPVPVAVVINRYIKYLRACAVVYYHIFYSQVILLKYRRIRVFICRRYVYTIIF